jgi:hypothetical protein
VGNSYPLLFNNPPAVQNMTLCLSYSLIQIGHRKPPQSLPLNSSTTKPSSRVRPGCAEQRRGLPIKTQICVLIFRPAVAALRGAGVAARSPPAVAASTRTALWKKAQPPKTGPHPRGPSHWLRMNHHPEPPQRHKDITAMVVIGSPFSPLSTTDPFTI